jgi:hypothetical protein
MMSTVGARVEMGVRYRGGACLGSRVGRQAPPVRLKRQRHCVQAGGFAALHKSVAGTSRTSGNVRLESAKWEKADIDRVGAGGLGLVLPYRNVVTIRPGLVRRRRVRAKHRL